ncbi:MAG: glycoside hydrolase family 65 [Lachnospiraceae bacterium]|nr:glycoside hydrolase family 65 [Lachnospiraceae bacterium]
MIHRENLIRQFNPVLNHIDADSPFTVGNGSFAFTADVTGMQTFYDMYSDKCPLLTMATEAWHRTPNSEGKFYGPENIMMTEYQGDRRALRYPVKCFTKNEEEYNWLRENPHRYNLLRLGLKLDGREILPADISDINQILDLYTGVLTSRFKIDGKKVKVETVVGSGMSIAVRIDSEILKDRLSIEAEFPYASPDKTGSDFGKEDRHSTLIQAFWGDKKKTELLLLRKMDEVEQYVHICGEVEAELTDTHKVTMSIPEGRKRSMSLCISFSKGKDNPAAISFKQASEQSKKSFYAFWNKGAMIDVSSSPDKRAVELQRRIILSMYLTFIQCTGKLPPQETGLTCNSWYGRFHLEMHPIHVAYLALYGRGDLLEKSLEFYLNSLEKAKALAKENGYKGARWPKMTSYLADQAPSPIAPLLIWQQPHVIYMLELLRRARYSERRAEVPLISEEEFLEKYKNLIFETAEFMADFAEYDEKNNRYVLNPPMYSVQEKGNPEEIFNPPFELAYWSFGLETAYRWMEKLSIRKEKWLKVARLMAKAPVEAGLLSAYEGFKGTYENLNMDHPSMLFARGFVGDDTEEEVLKASMERMKEKWDFDSLWGWDFAFLAMTYAKLGMYDEAFDMLLYKTSKNTYAVNGNNVQGTRKDLPLYLPGNGSLLLAMSALRSTEKWYVETEGIMKYPF